MRFALLGYGKMGKVIERIALQRGHEIVLKVTSEDKDYTLSNIDVAIDFSVPDAAIANISNCLDNDIPVISGTTGWLERYDDMVKFCETKNGAFLYASNFSLGVNIFFELNRTLSKLMKGLLEYDVSIEEIHDTQKLDAPSDTAISLAKDIIAHPNYNSWTLDASKSDEIGIGVKRIENVPGTHEITYKSEIDTIQIKHTAHNMEGFALGAVVAAEWIIGKKGIFTMKDVL